MLSSCVTSVCDSEGLSDSLWWYALHFPTCGENICRGLLQAIDLQLIHIGGGVIIATAVGFAERCADPISFHVMQGKEAATHLYYKHHTHLLCPVSIYSPVLSIVLYLGLGSWRVSDLLHDH